MIYFIVLAVIITLLSGRNPLSMIEKVNFRLPYLLLGSFAAQIVIFILSARTNRTYPYWTEAAILAVLLFLWLNRKVPGIPLIFLGALWNWTALVIHGGLMPVSDTALAWAGLGSLPENEPRHQLMEASAFWWMGDWIPLVRKVISIGDVGIGAGLIRFMLGNSVKRRKNEGP